MTPSRIAGALGITGLAASLWIGTAIAQDAQLLPQFPALLSDITARAIDRGIRDLDPPRAPRHENTLRVADDGGGGEPFIRGSIIVKFRAGTTPEARRAMLSQVNGSTTRALPYASFDLVSIDAAADPERVAQRLDTQPDVEYAQARYRIYPAFVPNDPLYPRQWNYPAIDMERAWDINPGATPAITVAVLDSGVAFRSGVFGFNARAFRLTANDPIFPALGFISVPFAAAPDLGGVDRFVAPRDFIWDNATPLDLDGHGTHVSGIIGQLTNNGVGAA
ncbi:MAG: hypothetical protein IH849_07015 [Acidobacteria bacterium]|nr:hypothetical protein [Acidobacteriota bacterium]